MLWPATGEAGSQRLDEVVVLHAALRAGHFVRVVAVEVEPLVGQQQGFLASVALQHKQTGAFFRGYASNLRHFNYTNGG